MKNSRAQSDVWGLFSLAADETSFDQFKASISGPIGVILLIGWSWVFFYHLCNGIRHLIQDTGAGYAIVRLISCRRGMITILDRAGLEAASCACYRIDRDAYYGLLGCCLCGGVQTFPSPWRIVVVKDLMRALHGGGELRRISGTRRMDAAKFSSRHRRAKLRRSWCRLRDRCWDIVMQTQWHFSSTFLPCAGETVDFLLEEREQPIHGTFANGIFHSRWADYDADRVASWRESQADPSSLPIDIPNGVPADALISTLKRVTSILPWGRDADLIAAHPTTHGHKHVNP